MSNSLLKATVLVDHGELARFRRHARQCFPREAFAFLVGERVNQQFRVAYLDYPQAKGQDTGIDIPPGDLQAAEARARREGYRILGGIHTHPDVHDASPSEHDYQDAQKYGEEVQGICAVWRDQHSWRFITKIRFYVGFPLAEIEVKERTYSRRHRRWLPVRR